MSVENQPLEAPINCFLQAQAEAGKPHAPGKKKIFVFCDGTGNQFQTDPDSPDGNSNVVKLYTTVRIADHQVAYYHPGVGTLGDPGARHWITKKWSMVKGLAFAAGFKDNVFDAYRYLMSAYADGDDIYIFGFSRGAYTARALAGLLHGYGLLCPGNEGHLPYAWKAFADQLQDRRDFLKESKEDRNKLRAEAAGDHPAHEHRVETDEAFLQTFSRKVSIRFMGIWDTVSSVGWIYEPLRLIDMAQNPAIRVGRHAVSIDERRAFYRDNLWGDPLPGQDIAQVWFPGVHSDVGGSYSQATSGPANAALEWMIDELRANGAELCEERVDMVLGRPCDGDYAARAIYVPPLHPDHCVHDSMQGPWKLLQYFPQQYYDKDGEQILWRVPLQTPRSIPSGSIIHGSAVKRLFWPTGEEPAYQPANLRAEDLFELSAPPFGTRAHLEGCLLYQPEKGNGLGESKEARRARLRKLWLWGVVVALAFTLVLSVPVLGLVALAYFVPVAALWYLLHVWWLWPTVLLLTVGAVMVRYKAVG